MSGSTRGVDGPTAVQDHPIGPMHDSGRRRPPRWVWALLVLLLVGAVVATVLVLANRPQPQAEPVTLEPEIVTLPVPTPTVDPVPVEGGSAFFSALPRSVLAYVVTEQGEEPALVGHGALEGYRLVYSDGGDTSLVAYASQWRDDAAATAAFDGVVAEQAQAAGVAVPDIPAAAADDAGSAAEPGLEQGVVEVEGTQVGRYLLLTRADGSAVVWWTNATVLMQVEGPAQAVRDVYTAFPL